MSNTSDFIPDSISATVGNRPFNNPGNLRPVGQSKGFMQFATPEDGRRALEDDLAAKGGKGKTSVAKLISQWAPASDKNDTPSYINQVAKHLGVGPNDEIDLTDQALRAKVADAIQIREGTPLAKQVSGAGRGTINPPQGGSQPQFVGKPQTVDQENASFNARHPDASLTRDVGYGGMPDAAKSLTAGLEGAVDTLTMGTSDYATGGAAYLADKARGGNLSFPEVMAAVRARRQDVTAQHPTSTLAGNVGGAIYTGSGLLKGATNVVERALPMAGQSAMQSFNDNFKDSISKSTKDMTTEQVIQKGLEDSYGESLKSGLIGGAFSIGADAGLAVLKRIGESQGGQYAKKYLEDLIKNRPEGWEEQVNKVIQPWRDKLSEMTNSEGNPLVTPRGQVYEAKVKPTERPTPPQPVTPKGPLPVQDRVEPTMDAEPVLSDLAPKPTQVQGSAPEGTMGMLGETQKPYVRTDATPEQEAEYDKLFSELKKQPYEKVLADANESLQNGSGWADAAEKNGWSTDDFLAETNKRSKAKVMDDILQTGNKFTERKLPQELQDRLDNTHIKGLQAVQDEISMNGYQGPKSISKALDYWDSVKDARLGLTNSTPRPTPRATPPRDTMAMSGEPYTGPGATNVEESEDQLAQLLKEDRYPQGILSGPNPWALDATKEPMPVTQAPLNRDPWSLTAYPTDLGTDEEAAKNFISMMGKRYPEDKLLAQGPNPWEKPGVNNVGSNLSDLVSPTVKSLAATTFNGLLGGAIDYSIDAGKNYVQNKPLPNYFPDYALGDYAKWGGLGGLALSANKYGRRIIGPAGLKLATTSGQGLRSTINGGQIGINSNIRNTPTLENTSDFRPDESDFIPD